VRNLSFRYPKAANAALSGVDLTVNRGSLFGLLGPNGAGKTTLLSLLSGLLPCEPETVFIRGLDVALEAKAIRPQVSLVPQNFAFYMELTVQENLDFFCQAQLVNTTVLSERIERAVTVAGLQDFRNTLAGKLSGGLKRRLNIAIGLLNEPRLLFLDEPTVGIDSHSRHFILESIKAIN